MSPPEDGRAVEGRAAADRPHVLLLITDDQGPWALGRETPEILTPTLDRLIAEGTYLRRFFCASPVCSPARASLLTGRMPSAHGVHDWLRPEGLERPQPPGSCLEGLDTIAQLLRRGGYRCALAGKWHVGSSQEPAAGYDGWYAHRSGGGPYYGAPIWEFDPETGRSTAEPRPAQEERYFTDAVGDQAIAALDRHLARSGGDAPLFLQLTPTAPHDPWTGGNHPPELLELYRDTDFPHVPNGPWHPWFVRESFAGAVADRHAHLAGYAAAVTGVDRMLARVLDAFAQRGLLEDTIVLVTSDNGFSCGHHGMWGKGNGTRPLNFWENSIRVPFIAWGPGRIAAGRVVDELVSATGLYETLAELTGALTTEDPVRAGRSFAPLLRADGVGTDGAGAGSGRADGAGVDGGDNGWFAHGGGPVVIHDEYGGNRMIRTARHKYVTRRDGPAELYDLETDPDEQHNLAEDPASAALRARLHRRLEEFFAAHLRPETDGWDLPVDGSGQPWPRCPNVSGAEATT